MITNKAILDLFEAASETLSIEQLEHLADADNAIELETDQIADTLSLIAMVVASEDQSVKPDEQQLASILSGLSQRTKTISVLAGIRPEAQYLAQKRKQESSAKRKPRPAIRVV